MAARKKAVDFEKALSELEALVSTMEKGDMSLEESLKAFEAGIKLTRDCQTKLSEAEQKVEMLIEQQGELQLTDFDPDAE
jgi:exodeoxyribonuclease VII small subunit